MKIITVTANPAYDVHCTVQAFAPFRENYADSVIRSCGGKGINISKMLNTLSVPNEVCIILGRENCAVFDSCLKDFRCMKFYSDSPIRENITIHSEGMKETRISADTFSVTPAVFDAMCSYILENSGSDTVVAFSGRLPRGIEKSAALRFFEKLKKAGALLSLDSNSFTAEEIIGIKPWFIKPNEQELSSLFGIFSDGDELKCAQALHKCGIENVMLSLGERGCVFAGASDLLRVAAPAVSVKSTIGAGDSTVAGFIGAYSNGKPISDCVRLAVACGSAACTVDGTDIPPQSVIRELYKGTEVNKL